MIKYIKDFILKENIELGSTKNKYYKTFLEFFANKRNFDFDNTSPILNIGHIELFVNLYLNILPEYVIDSISE